MQRIELSEEPTGWRVTVRSTERPRGTTTLLPTYSPIAAMRCVERAAGLHPHYAVRSEDASKQVPWEVVGSRLVLRLP